MRLNVRVEQACEHTGGTVAPLYEYSGDCFRRGRKVRSRDSIHSREKGEKKVEQVRVITRTQKTLASLEFIPRKRLEEVSEECGGRYEFESIDKILIFASISAEVGLQLGSRKWATVGRKLELCLHTIVQGEDWDTVSVKVGE